jgi:hypothetical protein
MGKLSIIEQEFRAAEKLEMQRQREEEELRVRRPLSFLRVWLCVHGLRALTPVSCKRLNETSTAFARRRSVGCKRNATKL